jgi:hypothetical protein
VFKVKAQVLTLLPPLEQAPDQIASRPPVRLRVNEVPTLKLLFPVLPVGTLIPAGLETTLTPLRPDATMVAVAVVGAGFMAIVAAFATPPPVAVMVVAVEAETTNVEIANVPLVAPAGIVILAGTLAEALLLERVTKAPLDPAALASVTVPTRVDPPVTEEGASVNADKATCAAGVTVSTAETLLPPPDTVIPTFVEAVTAEVEILKPPLVDPAGITTVVGAFTIAELLTVTCNVSSTAAAAANVTVAKEVPDPPAAVVGLRLIDAGGAGGKTVTGIVMLEP